MAAESQSSFQYIVSMAFGSDDLTPYTAQYAWNSNQMAHAMMGFCIAVCCLFGLIVCHPELKKKAKHSAGSDPWSVRVHNFLLGFPLDFYVVLLFASIPFKEAVDLYLDSQNYSQSPVKANMGNLYFDSLTDISFWWTGMFLGTFMVAWFTSEERVLRRSVPLLGLIVCGAFCYFYAGPIWQNQKQTFDNSGMPFNYKRLAVLSGSNDLTIADNSPVQWAHLESGFRQPITQAEPSKKPPHQHFVIIGGDPAGRSRLAVSLGCEYAFRLRERHKYQNDEQSVRVKYYTATALLEKPTVLESLDTALMECVIIDDLDVATERPTKIDPDQAADYYKSVARERHDQNVIIPVEQLNKFNSEKIPLNSKALTKSPRMAQLSLKEFQKLPPPKVRNIVPPGAVDPEATNGSEKAELRARALALKELGLRTRPTNEESKDGITTIWVLAGNPGTSTSTTYQSWMKRKDGWIAEIAELLGVNREELRIIELQQPEQPIGPKP